MAEAAVETPQNRFFCHQCSVEISPTLPEYTCPRCQNGFIEEISDEFDGDRGGESDVEMDPASHFEEVFNRGFLDSVQYHLDPMNSQRSSQDDSSSSRMQEAGHPPVVHAIPQTRLTVRRLRPQQGPGGAEQNIESIIHQLISNLTTGITVLGTRPGFPMAGGMFPLYGNPGDYAWGTGGLDSIITQLLNQLDGTGPPPAAKEQIEGLPTVNITPEQVEANLQCSVCMDDFKLDEPVRRLPCKHHYHTDCIVPWLELHGTCPVCRKDLQGEDTSTLEPTLETSGEGQSSSGQGTSSSSQYDFSEEYD